MKPLRDLILVQRQDLRKEEKTESGLYLVTGEAANYNFKEDEDVMSTVVNKKTPTQKEFIGKLVETSKKKHGKHFEFYPGGGDVNLSKIETNERLKDIIFGRKDNSGKIIEVGDECKHFKKDETIIYKKHSEVYDMSGVGKDYVLVQEKDVLVKKENGNYFVHPDYVIVKISKESRDNVFRKKLIDDNGKEVFLFIPAPTDKSDERHSQFFVTCGEIYGVGSNIKEVEVGDTAILNYLVDNEDDIIIGYEGEDKLIVTTAITTRHETDYIVYANRRSPRDQIVSSKGDYIETCQLLGVVRNNELLPRDPYVFISHESTIVSKTTKSGIQYKVDEKIIKRKILALSEVSKKRCGLEVGEWVIMDDFDVFSITLDDKIISAINDIDIMCPSQTLEDIKEKLLHLGK